MFTPLPTLPKSPSQISPIEDAIADIRAGRMVVLMDDENRENEGDLCMAAEAVTPEAINFMAVHGRGLICLALAEERIDELGLGMMVSENRAPLGTAFTVPIDARHGIGSGISARDRAATILATVRDGAVPEDFVTPGHVFPLRARRGGVLVRTGQTEGGVDLARLAGLKPASVICEILNADGTMSRLPDIEGFAAAHGLKICTVADLVQYRLRCDSLVHRVAEAGIVSRYGGDFRIHVYTTDVDAGEHVALVKGEIDPDKPILVRAHAEFLPGDVFHMAERDTSSLLHAAMRKIADEGSGVIVYVRRDGRSAEIGDARTNTGATAPSTDPATRERDFREYGVGAQILRDLGVRKIRLLSNFARNLVSLPGYDLEIVECVPLDVPAARPQAARKRRARTKRA